MVLPGRAYKLHYSTMALFLATLTLQAVAVAHLFRAATEEAIRSPWQTVPTIFFAIFAAATLGIIALALCGSHRLALVAATTNAVLAFSIALIVYPLGYGFDPFIHQATEQIIRAHWMVTPFPIYGWGQYLPVVLLSYLPGLTIDLVDRLLLPLAAGIALPATLYFFAKRFGRTTREATLLAAFAVALPFSLFIMTTPQGLADLALLVLAFLLARPADRPIRFFLPGALTVYALVTHPIAGIPALILIGLYSILGRRLHPAILIVGWIATALVLPVALALSPLHTTVETDLFAGLRAVFHALPFPTLFIKNNHNLFVDLAELLKSNAPFIILGLALFGLARRTREFIPHFMTALALVASYLLTRGFIRLGTIDYESLIIPLRLLEVATLVILPATAIGVLEIMKSIRGRPQKIGGILLIVGLSVGSVYVSYPRVDRYERSSLINVTRATFTAVHEIEKSYPAPYIVLANQTAAAAVIHDYGFRQYFGPDFYYAHASGGLRLYKFYLDIADHGAPPRDTAAAAARAAGVPTVFFMIHDYWKNFNATVAAAKLSADSWQSIADGKIYIFKYDFTAKARETTP